MKLSAMLISDNHKCVIAQALGSMVQQTDCDSEIAYGEDCSTDKIREVRLDFLRRYPGRIGVCQAADGFPDSPPLNNFRGPGRYLLGKCRL
jgi:hypothetical protein